MLKVVEKQDTREASKELLPLDEISREGARRMLIEALKAEADDYVERHRGERDEQGRALVVRNGRGQGRKLTLGAGTVELKAPRVDDRRRDEQGGRQRFTSRLLPPYMRRSPKLAEVLPILYLRGLSTGDFRPALEGLLGEDAAGLSADQYHPTYTSPSPVSSQERPRGGEVELEKSQTSWRNFQSQANPFARG